MTNMHPNKTVERGGEKYFTINELRPEIKTLAVKGASITVFFKILSYVLQTGATVILARLLSPEDFGLVAMVAVITAIVVEFGILGLTEATIQREKIGHKEVSNLFWINIGLCVMLTLITICFSPLIAWFYNEEKLALISIVLSFSFVFHGLYVQHSALIQRRMEFFKLSVLQLFSIVVADIAAIVCALMGMKYWALVVRRVGITVMVAVGAWVLCPWRPGRYDKTVSIRPFLSFGINSMGNYFVNYLSRSIDKILIGWKLGTESLAFYDRAYHLFVMPVNQLTYPLTNVAVAALTKLVDDQETFKKYYLSSLSIMAFIGFGLSGIMTLNGESILVILLGEQWVEAGKIFQIFGPGIGAMLIYATHGWLFLSTNRAREWFAWGILSSIITIVLFILGVVFGAKGVALAYSLSFYVLMFPGILFGGKKINLKAIEIGKVLFKYFFSALITTIGFYLGVKKFGGYYNHIFLLNEIIKVCAHSAGFATIYLMILFVMQGGGNPLKEMMKVYNLIQKKN